VKSVFARISTAIVAVAAVAASALIATAPASATPSTTNVTKLSYTMAWQPGGTTSVTMDATRVDFNAQYRYVNAGSLVGRALTVGTLTTGLPAGKSLYDYAYFSFFTSNDFTGRITFNNPCGTGTTDGLQINATGSGGQCTSVTVPANTVAMTISYTSAFNGSSGTYSNLMPANTSITATPRVFNNGALITATSVVDYSAPAPVGLYYMESNSYSTVQGYHTSMTIPATGVTKQASVRQSVCVDFTGFRSASNDTISAVIKINGTAVPSMDSDYSWGLAGGYSFPLYGNTLSTTGNSSVATWETNHVATIQTNAGGTVFNPTAGSTVTATTEVTNGATNVVVSCAPSTPTATGTLGTSMGSLSFTPDASYTGKNWVVNVYRNDNDVLVGSGQGMGSSSTQVNGISSMNAPPAAIPYGVPLYAKVAIALTISDNYGGGGTSFNSAFTTAKSAVYTLPFPVVSFPTNPSGLTTEGKAGITSDTMSFAAQVPAMSFLWDNMVGMGPKRTPYSDEKGGYWYWNDNVTVAQNSNATGSLKLYHYTQAGVDTAFAGGNGATLETTPEYSYLRMGWAGDRDHWVAAVTKDSTVYGNGNTPWSDYHYGLDVITGTMNGTFTKKSYTYSEMDAFCGSVYPNSLHKNNSVSVVNNPTSDPWLMINCSNTLDSNMVNANRVAYAKSTSAGLVSLFAFNNTDPTVDNYTTIVGGTVYPNASASTDTAVVAMFATGRATSSSQINSGSASVVKRGLVRITKDGTATVLVGEAAWHEASASSSTSGVSQNASFLSLPGQSANGSLLGLMKNGSNYAILNAGTSGGFATVTSADNITYDEVSAPTAYAMQSSLAWVRGGSNIVGLNSAPVLTRTSMNAGMTPSYNLAQAKLDWSTRKVSTQEIITYARPSAIGVVASTFVDMNGRLVFAYTKAENQLGFVRWVGAASLPDGVNVTSQSTSYVINAGGDVVLTGTGLGATSGATKVLTATVNGVAATIKSRTATTLTITAPANNAATAQAPVTGNIELGFAGDQGGVVGQLTYVGATKLTPVITQTLDEASAFFGDADRDFSASVAMTPGATPTLTNTTTSAVCSIVNNKVRFIAAGNCVVTSTVVAGGYFNGATATKTIVVSKPTPTITLSVGDLTAFASDADRTVTATAVLDTNGTAPNPVVTATPASVCVIAAGKVDFVGAGSCVVKAAIAASAAINADTKTATIVVTKVTPTVTVSIDGASSAFTVDDNRNVVVSASAGTPILTSKSPLVCAIVPAAGQTPVQVKFVGTGSCVVKAQVASSATLNASSVVESAAVTVRKKNVISVAWAPGMAANASGDASGAPLSSITLASGADPVVTSPTPTVCEYQSDGTVWIKGRDLTCTIHIETPASDSVWGSQSFDWTFTTLAAIGDSADSALLVRNDGIVVPLAATAVSWKQSTSTVKLVLYSKSSVGVMRGQIKFTGRDNVEYTCYSNFGSNTKATAATLNTVRAYTSGALCADAVGHTVAEKNSEKTALSKLKELVTFNTGIGQGTSVQLSYKWEKHKASSGNLRENELLLNDPNKAWTADSYAKLHYLVTDKLITAALPGGATTAPVSATADGAFVPAIAFESKRNDYTLTARNTDKCDVTVDGRIWAKVAGESCTITVATESATTVWDSKSTDWTFTMSAASVAADAASAVIAPSNNTAVKVGPLTVTWNQATSAVVATFTSRDPGKVTAQMTFTGLDSVSYTCSVNVGPATVAAVPAATRGSYVTQANTVKFCGDTKLTGLAKTAQATALTKFTQLVTARKSGAGQGVIPVAFAYKFERHDRATGALIGSALADQSSWSADLWVKLNYRATAN
jgi:hypothetical protein